MFSFFSYTGHAVVLPFSMVSAMLRMGSKYQVDVLCAEAIERFRTCFPTSLSDFDLSRDDEIVAEESHSKPNRFPFRLVAFNGNTEVIEVITLARRFDLGFLLPTAFYACCYFAVEELIDAAREGIISFDDLKIVIRGRLWLEQKNIELLMPILLRRTNALCKTSSACRGGFGALLHAHESWLNSADPLDHSRNWLTNDEVEKAGICDGCIEPFRLVHELGRRTLWDEMGKEFGVSEWPLD